jgi:hypothetical protein
VLEHKEEVLNQHLKEKQDIIDFAESCNVEGAIVFVDLRKALDSLEWTFILTTL